MAQTLETLIVQLQADVRGLKTGLDNAVKESKAAARDIEGGFTGIGRAATRLGPVIATGLAAGVTAITSLGAAAVASGVKLGNYADKILDLEQQTGLTTDRLQQFELVARTAGVPVETLANQASGLTRRLRGAGDESKVFTDNLEALGIQTRTATGELRSTDELLPEIIRELSGIESITERNAIAFQVFGRQAEQLAPVLALGADEIDRLGDEALALGQVLDRETLEAANHFRIEFENLNAEFGIAVREIGVALLPVLTDLARVFREDIAPVITSAVNALADFVELITTSKTDRLVEEYEKLRAKTEETTSANKALADELERVTALQRDAALASLNEDARRVALQQVQLAERIALAQETVLANERIAAAQQTRLERERGQRLPIGIPELERNVAEGLASVEAAKAQLAALEALEDALQAEAAAIERTRVEILRPDVVDAIYGPATDAATSAAAAADNASNAASSAAAAASYAADAAEDAVTGPTPVDLTISPTGSVSFTRAIADAMSEALKDALAPTPGAALGALPRVGGGIGLPELTGPQGLFEGVPTFPTVQGVVDILDEAILARAGDIGVGLRDAPFPDSAAMLAGLQPPRLRGIPGLSIPLIGEPTQSRAGLAPVQVEVVNLNELDDVLELKVTPDAQGILSNLGVPGLREFPGLSIPLAGEPTQSRDIGLALAGAGLALDDLIEPLTVITPLFNYTAEQMESFAKHSQEIAQGLADMYALDLKAAEDIAVARDRFLEYQTSRLAALSPVTMTPEFAAMLELFRFENLRPTIPVSTPDGFITQDEANEIKESADALEAAGATAAEELVNGVIAGIESGDISGALQGIFDALASYAATAIGTAIGGPGGAIVGALSGALISGVSRAAFTPRAGRSEREEAAAVSRARVPSAIRIDFTFNQSNSLGLIDDPATRSRLRDVSTEAFQRFEDVLKRNLVPRLEALEGRVFA